MTTTVTTSTVGTGPPAVDVTVTWTIGGVTQVTVNRVNTATGSVTPLRLGNPATLSGTAVTIRDYEVPDNTAVTYQAYPVGAPASAVSSGSVTVPERGTWLIHPTQPSTLSYQALVGTWPAWSRTEQQDVTYIIGVENPIVVSDVRSGKTGTLSLIVQSAADKTNLDNLLKSTRIMLLNSNRYPAPYEWVSVGNETWTPLQVKVGAASTQLWQVDLALVKIDRPTITSSGIVTWLDVSTHYATFDLLSAAEANSFDQFWIDAATWTT